MNVAKERLRRNMVFIPGHMPDHIQVALLDPDMDSALFDLEDLVSPDMKPKARQLVSEAIRAGAFQAKGIETVVRINHPATPFFEDDMAAIMPAKPDMIRIPKVENKDDVLFVEKIVSGYERKLGFAQNTVMLMSAIESPRGVLNAYEIATASPRMLGMALSSADYTREMQAERTKEGIELDWARGMLLHCARAAGVFVMDTSFIFQDLAAFEAEARRAKAMGFDGKTGGTMWPGQTAILSKVFSPSPEEIAYAEKVLAMEKQYLDSGAGFASEGDMFFDKPVVDRYRRLLRIAKQLENRKRCL